MALRAPSGAVLRGASVGGRYLSTAQAGEAISATSRASKVAAASRGVVYETRLPEIIVGLQLRCNVASHEEAEDILEDARSNLLHNGSYITGNLYDSLYLIDLDLAEDFGVATDVEYAPYVEFGTVHSAPKPYIIPAVEAHRASFINRQTVAVQEATRL